MTNAAAMYAQLGLAPAEGVIETVQAAYEAFDRGDIPAVLELLADDVAWQADAPDHGVPWLRSGTGREAAARCFDVIGRRMDIARRETTDMLASGNRVAVVVDIAVTDRESGRDLCDRSEVHLFTVEDGRITAVRQHVDTLRHVAAARG